MSLTLDLQRTLQTGSTEEAWAALSAFVWDTCSLDVPANRVCSEITNRDRAVGAVDYALATTCWSLWNDYEATVPQTADVLVDWWAARSSGRAVLILDALSMREAPWLLKGAADHGFTVHSGRTTGAELPADTTPFAKALGYSQRSALESNGGKSEKFAGATTECVDLPWGDCVGLVGPSPDILFWHHWPDIRLHDLDDPGEGVERLSEEAAESLSSDDFWAFVTALCQGRRLVITGDHGYAASGLFPDVGDDNQASYLKSRFKSRRWTPAGDGKGKWTPPLCLTLGSRHGTHEFVLGRRKWKSPGGYPTLTHGGLSLLEVLVPWIELSRT
ncbi:MAG: hypothetical protein HN341_15700 [Verrucomicrobia bacterium]|nr:hypothetical protein [Verrucomicrobiota bacterium]